MDDIDVVSIKISCDYSTYLSILNDIESMKIDVCYSFPNERMIEIFDYELRSKKNMIKLSKKYGDVVFELSDPMSSYTPRIYMKGGRMYTDIERLGYHENLLMDNDKGVHDMERALSYSDSLFFKVELVKPEDNMRVIAAIKDTDIVAIGYRWRGKWYDIGFQPTHWKYI